MSRFEVARNPRSPFRADRAQADNASATKVAIIGQKTKRLTGPDLETLIVRSRKGGKIWEGYSGIVAKDGKTAVEFANLRWDDNNRLTAEVHPVNTEPKILVLSWRSGKWVWVEEQGR